MRTASRVAVAVLVGMLSASACSSGHNRAERRASTTGTTARSPIISSSTTSTTTSTAAATTGGFVFTDRQLAGALLQPADLPPGFGPVPPSRAADGLCQGVVATTAVPAATSAVIEFNGPTGAVVREVLRDFAGTSTAYIEEVRRATGCAGYRSIPSDQIGKGIDTANGATGIGVSVDAVTGNVVNIVWVHQGDLVIEVRASGGATSGVGTLIGLAGQALARMKQALA
jgi:hypothetical protein